MGNDVPRPSVPKSLRRGTSKGRKTTEEAKNVSTTETLEEEKYEDVGIGEASPPETSSTPGIRPPPLPTRNPTTSIGSHTVAASDIEYTAESKGDDMMDDTWRQLVDFCDEEKHIMLRRVKKHSLYDEEEVPQYNVLLLGMVSHGKTSVINTMASAIIGEVMSLTPAGTGAGGTGESVTKQFRMHKFKSQKRDANQVKLRYCDTMGVEGGEAGIKKQDLLYILDGHVKDRYTFNAQTPICPGDEYFERNPKIANRIHAVAVVVDASTLDQIGGKALEKITEYKKIVTSRNVPFCVLMTKVDLIFPAILKKEAYTMYFSRTVKEAVDKCGVIFGVPTNQVFPLKNYDSEMDVVPAFDILTLTACLKLMHMADGYVRTHLD